MDLKIWTKQKINFIRDKLNYKSIVFYLFLIVAVCVMVSFLHTLILYSAYNHYADNHIDAYLDKTSENIMLKSSNETEIAQNIVEWEYNEFAIPSNRFDISTFFMRHISHEPGWYLFLNRGSCGELAIVFEDMANRTGVTSRRVAVNGFIHFDGYTENHAWSEVLINGTEWHVADSGFNYSPPKDHCYGYSKSRLLGPVYAFENGIAAEDRSTYYIPNTETIMIKSIHEGEIVPNCSIDIEMHHGGSSKEVIGTKIKLETNESGLCPVTLGVYKNTTYTIKVIDGIYQGKEKIISGNNTGYVEIEIKKLNPLTVIALLVLIFFNIIVWKPIFRKKSAKKEKHEKL